MLDEDTIFINGSVVNCKLDSGAEANVMSKAVTI